VHDLPGHARLIVIRVEERARHRRAWRPSVEQAEQNLGSRPEQIYARLLFLPVVTLVEVAAVDLVGLLLELLELFLARFNFRAPALRHALRRVRKVFRRLDPRVCFHLPDPP